MATEAHAPPRSKRPLVWEFIAAAVLLAWYVISALTAVSGKSATFDEPFHLTGGYTYWMLNDFRIQPENGNLPQRFAALPLLFGNYRFPSLNDAAWLICARPQYGQGLSEKFFYAVGNDADAMLFRGRAMIALVGAALGALVFVWTRRLLGTAPAFASLTLFVFSPTMLSHGALATSDMTAALLMTASVGGIWVVLNRLTWKSLLISSLVMGGLFISKFSAVLIVPMGLLLLTVQLASARPMVVSWGKRAWSLPARRWRFPLQLGLIAVHVIVVWLVIWAAYNFRFSMFNETTSRLDPDTGERVVVDRPMLAWNTLAKSDGGLAQRVVLLARERHLLPEAYLYGFIFTVRAAESRRAFLNGEFSADGWRSFFLVGLSIKTPLTLFVLMGLGGAAIALAWRGDKNDSSRQRRGRMLAGLYRAAPLIALFVVYWAFAISSHLNIGHRHILPTYPPMFMLGGAAALWLVRSPRDATGNAEAARGHVATDHQANERGRRAWQHRLLVWATFGCLGLFCVESIAQRPNYLAYFNQLVGGSKYGYRHLVDSSLDWGQELPAISRYIAQLRRDAPDEKIYLSYFGNALPQYYGIDAKPLPSYFEYAPPHEPQPLEAGTYLISATMLPGVYTKFPGRWTRKYNSTYQQLSALMRRFDSTANDPEARQEFIDQIGGEEVWKRGMMQYMEARFARLCSFLRQREPDDEINDSVLVYHVSPAELRRALKGPPIELSDEP